jgi:iron-sulfur cluster insertion protein
MALNVDSSAADRIRALRQAQGNEALMLRVRVEGGGCSGFRYTLELTDKREEKDIVESGLVVTDDISMPFLEGAVIHFEEGLIGAEFKIKNPNAASGCGCGESFSVV